MKAFKAFERLTKEYYCYKIHTLVIESNAYPPSIDNTPKWTTPQFSQENFEPPLSMIFQKCTN